MNKTEKKRTPRKLPKKSKGFLWNFSKRLEKASNFGELHFRTEWAHPLFRTVVELLKEKSDSWMRKPSGGEERLLIIVDGVFLCLWYTVELDSDLKDLVADKALSLFGWISKHLYYPLCLFVIILLRYVWHSERKEPQNLYTNLPTEGREQIIASFLEVNPIIDRTADVYGFIKKITLLNPQKRNVIALDGKWGCGKSTFVGHVILLRTFMFADEAKRWGVYSEDQGLPYLYRRLRLRCAYICKECKEQGDSGDGKINLSLEDEYFYYDTWQNDAFDGEPILSILYNLFPEELKTPVMERFKNRLQKFVNLIEAIENWSILLPPDVHELVRAFMVVCKLCRDGIMIKDNNDNVRGEFIEAERYKRLHREIGNLIGLLIKKRSTEELEKKRFVIFIDELDRCNPLFAVRVLERVKHFFDNEKLVFVFSVNLEQLQHTIRKVYGHDFDAIHYLHRFFTERAELPAVDTKLFIRNEYLGAKKKQEKTEEQNNG